MHRNILCLFPSVMRCAWRRSRAVKFKTLSLAVLVSFALLFILCYVEGFSWTEQQPLDIQYFGYPLDDNITTSISQLMSGLQPDVAPINRHTNAFINPNIKKCLNLNGQRETVDLLFVVKSAVTNFAHRNAIRRTWGQEERFSDLTIRRIFSLGRLTKSTFLQNEVEREHQTFGDIVQSDFVDSYYNNTLKTLMGFRWVVQYCPGARFIMFVDDDMYVSVKNLLRFASSPHEYPNQPPANNFPHINNTLNELKETSPYDFNQTDPYFFAGYVKDNDSPFRKKDSKWYIPLSEYPFNAYPPYVPAGAFLLSFSTLQRMYYTSLYTKHFLYDDVFLGLVAKKAGIIPFHNYNFQFWGKPIDYKHLIVAHDYGNSSEPSNLVAVWKKQYVLQYA